MGVSKVVYSGDTLIDLTNDTVTADTLSEGVTAHGANGEEITGTMTAVQYGKEQSLTEDQRAQARNNIGVVFSSTFPRTPQDNYKYQQHISVDDVHAFSIELPESLWESWKYASVIKATASGDAITDAAYGPAYSVVTEFIPKTEDGSPAPAVNGGRFSQNRTIYLGTPVGAGGFVVYPYEQGLPSDVYMGSYDWVTGHLVSTSYKLNANEYTIVGSGTNSTGLKYVQLDVPDLTSMIVCNRYIRNDRAPYADKSIRVSSVSLYIYDSDINLSNPEAVLEGLEFLMPLSTPVTYELDGFGDGSGGSVGIWIPEGTSRLTSPDGPTMVTYGIDTKTYIDRKFAELSAALLGG